jgi:hypothetical protein
MVCYGVNDAPPSVLVLDGLRMLCTARARQRHVIGIGGNMPRRKAAVRSQRAGGAVLAAFRRQVHAALE